MRIVDQGIGLLSHIGTEIFAAKTAIKQSMGFSSDALHIISGVLLLLVAAFVLRSSLRNFKPWLALLGLALLNELNDLHVRGWPDGSAPLVQGGKDIILILLLPTLLLVVARTRPNLLARR